MAIPKNEEDIETLLSANSAWTTTYGDLMSSLMIVFLVLYAFFFANQAKVDIFAKDKAATPKYGVNINLKEKAFFPYKPDSKEGLQYALKLANKQLDTAQIEIQYDKTVDKEKVRKGLYNSNWVTKVVLVIEPVDKAKDKNKYYIVNKGDNLWTVSNKYLGDPVKYKEMATESKLKDPNKLEKGDLIVVPNPPTQTQIITNKVAKKVNKVYTKAERSTSTILSNIKTNISKIFKK